MVLIGFDMFLLVGTLECAINVSTSSLFLCNIYKIFKRNSFCSLSSVKEDFIEVVCLISSRVL